MSAPKTKRATVGRPALYGKTMRQLSVAVSPEHEAIIRAWRRRMATPTPATISDAAVVRAMIEYANRAAPDD